MPFRKSIILAATSLLVSQAQAIDLKCDDIVIRGVGPAAQKVVIENYLPDAWEIPAQKDGDCGGRSAFLCYQSGQFMVNVPKAIFKAQFKGPIHVWINGDTDDIPDPIYRYKDKTVETRFGERYICSVL